MEEASAFTDSIWNPEKVSVRQPEQTENSQLLDLLEWVRDKLERLHRLTESEFVRRNLHALIRSCDPETNPRLKNVVEDLDADRRGSDSVGPGKRPD